MSIITIENDDQKIVSTNYWMSEYSRAGIPRSRKIPGGEESK